MIAETIRDHRLVKVLYTDEGKRYFEIPDGQTFDSSEDAVEALTPEMLREDAEDALDYFDTHLNDYGAEWVAQALRDVLVSTEGQ